MRARRLTRDPAGTVRRRGEIDMTDLLVGLAIAVVLPWLVLAAGAMFSEESGPEPTMGEKPKIPEPPLTVGEVDMRIESSRIVLDNAKEFIRLMETVEDAQLKDDYRLWADKALQDALGRLGDVTNKIREHPQGEAGFVAQLTRVRRLRAGAEGDLRQVQKLDILGDR